MVGMTKSIPIQNQNLLTFLPLQNDLSVNSKGSYENDCGYQISLLLQVW